MTEPQATNQQRSNGDATKSLDVILKRALATPPISDEDILKRSKESHS
ncbi:MAG TPA: hypothetical protein VL094_04025 [Sphingomonadaceae bacterium]|nr:hypothetical protein [Sphingomonadaceae bacterium]